MTLLKVYVQYQHNGLSDLSKNWNKSDRPVLETIYFEPFFYLVTVLFIFMESEKTTIFSKEITILAIIESTTWPFDSNRSTDITNLYSRRFEIPFNTNKIFRIHRMTKGIIGTEYRQYG